MVKRRIQHEPSLLRRLYCYYEWMSLRAYERKMCPRFAANVVVSDDDARILESIAPSAVFSTVENGVDTDYFAAGLPATSHRLVFAGRLDQYANRHGILTFMKQVWPALRAIHPDVCIDIIGNGPPEALLRMAEDNVRVHGFVSDVRPFFREASVAICPLWDGGGTRLKILDTLAQGTPLVATSIGCEGLDLVHERDALIVDTPAEFTAQISRLFGDPALRSVLSANGRKLVERSYSWEAIAPKLASAYAAAAMPTGRLGVPQSTEQAPTGVVTRMVDIRSASGRASRINDPPST